MIYAVDITKDNILQAIKFCLPYEAISVNLISFLMQEAKKPFASTVIPQAKLFYQNTKIIGLACINKHSFLLYCFSFYNRDIYESVISTFDFNLIYAMMGEANFQKNILILLSKVKKAKIIVPYILMTKLKTESTIKLPINDIKIYKANIKDTKHLIELQVLYEKEEVCQNKKEFPRYISLMNLEHILKNETTYFAKLGNLSVAKANTNASGVNYAQIGGVYTLPEYRGYGFASNVVNVLIEHIHKKEEKNVCLFVKADNIKAIKMYKRLGLKEKGEFCISYFN
ncbi:MAG: GNAT family N-acetyltransferase [Treponema sp.]